MFMDRSRYLYNTFARGLLELYLLLDSAREFHCSGGEETYKTYISRPTFLCQPPQQNLQVFKEYVLNRERYHNANLSG